MLCSAGDAGLARVCGQTFPYIGDLSYYYRLVNLVLRLEATFHNHGRLRDRLCVLRWCLRVLRLQRSLRVLRLQRSLRVLRLKWCLRVLSLYDEIHAHANWLRVCANTSTPHASERAGCAGVVGPRHVVSKPKATYSSYPCRME
jgi:hypothetical protein|eukprot:COSAG02_NODE_23_length_52893_cov_58.101868_22_plen_144_part_00